MNREVLRLIVTWIACFGLGFSLSLVYQEASAPNCPQEDSCTAEYYDHEWHIKEVRP